MKTFTCFIQLILLFIALYTSPITLQAQSVYLGMTEGGGTAGKGAIIRFNPANDSESVVWSFAGSPTDGAYPRGNLVQYGGNGLFYGMAHSGGDTAQFNAGAGIIFSFDPVTDSEKVLWTFGSGKDGRLPYGSLVYNARAGVFYGMTQSGGANDSGAIISFNPVNNSENVVYSFRSAPNDGYYPDGDLAYDTANGLYYGLTSYGGTKNTLGGAIFSFNPVTDSEKVVWNFGYGTDGYEPLYGAMIYDASNGLFYGMAPYGGKDSSGVIFSFNPATDSEKVVWNFAGDYTDASAPQNNLVYDAANGLFYGMSYYGGDSGIGTIFSFDPATDRDSLLWSFSRGPDSDGVAPANALVYNSTDSLLYGMVSTGGKYNSLGVIISFNPADDSEKVLWDFGNGTDGEVPFGELALYNPLTGIATVSNTSSSIHVYPDPNNGQFTVTGLAAGQIVEVYNCLGQKISRVVTENATQQLDISSASNGLYIVRISNNTGTAVDEKKIVKVD